MAVNDIYTLPKQMRSMSEMSDLLTTEQCELDLFNELVKSIEEQLCISTATYSLDRYERQFALPYNTQQFEERRAKIIAKLNTRGSTTVVAIKELVDIITGNDSSVIEQFNEYRFSVVVHLIHSASTSGFQELIKLIEEIKPAHLAFNMVGAIKVFPFVNTEHIELSALTINLRLSNFGVDIIYLGGRRKLDGSWSFDQLFNKGIAFHNFNVAFGMKNENRISEAITLIAKCLNLQKANHPIMVISLWATVSERVLHNDFKASTFLLNNQSVKGAITENTMYCLDGSSRLDGTKKFNAEIKRSELL